jgi:hypothetical protein
MRSFRGRRVGRIALAVGTLAAVTLPSAHTNTVDAIRTATNYSPYVVTVDHGRGRTLYYVDPVAKATELVFTGPAGGTEDAYAIRPARGGLVDTRTVDYVRHTWRDRSAPQDVRNPAHEIAMELSVGRAIPKLAGIDVVEGALTYRVVLAPPDGGAPTTIWISATTALPVRSTSPGVTVTYRWHVARGDLPASLWPAVPSGFRQRSTPAS